MAEPKTPNLGLNLSVPTSPDVRGEWPASQDENLQIMDAKIQEALDGCGGGSIAPFLVGNDGTFDWLGTNDPTSGTGRDNIAFNLSNAAGTDGVFIGITAGISSLAVKNITMKSGGALDLEGPNDIIDAGANPGNPQDVLISLGEGNGVQWKAPNVQQN